MSRYPSARTEGRPPKPAEVANQASLRPWPRVVLTGRHEEKRVSKWGNGYAKTRIDYLRDGKIVLTQYFVWWTPVLTIDAAQSFFIVSNGGWRTMYSRYTINQALELEKLPWRYVPKGDKPYLIAGPEMYQGTDEAIKNIVPLIKGEFVGVYLGERAKEALTRTFDPNV